VNETANIKRLNRLPIGNLIGHRLHCKPSPESHTIEPRMQLALSSTFAPTSIPVWDELSGNLRQGFTTKNQDWNPGSNAVNSTVEALKSVAENYCKGVIE
jgi:hypothetical protein